MNILAIAPYKFLPARNGGQKAIEMLYKSLSKHAALTCISTADNDLTQDQGFELIPLFSNSKMRYADLFAVNSIIRFIRKRNITHLIIEHPYMGMLALLIQRSTGVRLIVHSHNIEGERFASMKKWWAPQLASYEKYIHRKADLSLFITEEDRNYALRNFDLQSDKTLTVPFAVSLNECPSWKEKNSKKKYVCEKHGIANDKKLIVFAGAFDYAPNREALEILTTEIVSKLNEKKFNYHLLVCGKGISDSSSTNDSNITYTGFVENIHDYYIGSEIFVNPVTKGGGIKTKLVEALADNCDCVSFQTGAIGIPAEIAGEKLAIIPDNNIDLFVQQIMHADQTNDTPQPFYDYFNADKIAQRILLRMKTL